MTGMTTTPSWLYYIFAVAMLALAGYALVFLINAFLSRRGGGADVQLSHLFMGVSMAGMFEVRWAFGPNAMWEIVFAVLLVWFSVGSLRSIQAFGLHLPHAAVHALMSLAMLLMYWFPMGSSTGMSMSMSSAASGAHLDPGVAFVVALMLLGSAIATLASAHRGSSVYGTHVAFAGGDGSRTADLSTGVEHLSGSPSTVGGAGAAFAAPWVLDLTHVVMSIAMGFMLILML